MKPSSHTDMMVTSYNPLFVQDITQSIKCVTDEKHRRRYDKMHAGAI